jgi:hypothetical protein
MRSFLSFNQLLLSFDQAGLHACNPLLSRSQLKLYARFKFICNHKFFR